MSVASGSLAREKALADLTYMMENRSPAAMSEEQMAGIGKTIGSAAVGSAKWLGKDILIVAGRSSRYE
jgi:hypothetical protein